MKLKRIVASALAIMTVATGAMGITASASSHSYSFSLSAGGVGYTSSYSTSGSSYGSVKPTSGVSSADFCTATFCNILCSISNSSKNEHLRFENEKKAVKQVYLCNEYVQCR